MSLHKHVGCQSDSAIKKGRFPYVSSVQRAVWHSLVTEMSADRTFGVRIRTSLRTPAQECALVGSSTKPWVAFFSESPRRIPGGLASNEWIRQTKAGHTNRRLP